MEAQFVLAFLYDLGIGGVVRDDREAVRLYRLAAEQGHAKARNNLGSLCAAGRGVQRDYREAIRLYRLAAEQGNEEARLNLEDAKQINWDPETSAISTPLAGIHAAEDR